MSLDLNLDKILIIDFGSQFTQLIVRRIRELGVFSELISHKKIKSFQIKSNIKGIILSGGPLNVYQLDKNSFKNSGVNKSLLPVKNIRKISKKDMILNNYCPKIEVNPETYEVLADGELITCEPAKTLPLAQRYFLY